MSNDRSWPRAAGCIGRMAFLNVPRCRRGSLVFHRSKDHRYLNFLICTFPFNLPATNCTGSVVFAIVRSIIQGVGRYVIS